MLLARLLSKIYKKNGIVLIDSQGQKYICGKPDLQKPLTIKLLKRDLSWKLVLNPDLNFPEAYMRGEIDFENDARDPSHRIVGQIPTSFRTSCKVGFRRYTKIGILSCSSPSYENKNNIDLTFH